MSHPIFSGCGNHIEIVLRGIAKDDRCKCNDKSTVPILPSHNTSDKSHAKPPITATHVAPDKNSDKTAKDKKEVDGNKSADAEATIHSTSTSASVSFYNPL